MARYPHLFSSFHLGSLTLRNRIVLASVGTNLSNRDGTVSDRAIGYYSERACGGAGLLITESSPVSILARHRPESLCGYHDSFLPSLKRFTAAIHQCGSAACFQLHHSGRVIAKTVGVEDGRVVISKEGTEVKGVPPFAPSPVPREPGAPMPREMTLADIQEVISQFGGTARRAKEAGFDALEIHAAHGYLIQQFLSPRVNKRKDQYGGNGENRARFLLEVVDAVRKEVGESFPVVVRLGVDEHVEGSYELEEVLDWAVEIERHGASAINVTGGSAETLLTVNHVAPPMTVQKGCYVPQAAMLKKILRIPIMGVGRLDHPRLAERILREGLVDFVVMGRPFLSDPHWPAKAARGEEDRIRRCIACNYCLWVLFQQKPITCLQNPTVGREEEGRIRPAEKPKKVLVIGGGPGGMEAARVARQRGHQVTLIEKTSRLGGQVLLACALPQKQNMGLVIDWLSQEIAREGVEIKLNGDALEWVRKEKPDAVILATGASPIARFAYSGPDLCNAWEVLAGRETGQRVIIIGGGMVGMETAEFLFQKGRQVTVLTSREGKDQLAVDMEPFTRALFLQRLALSSISIIFAATVLEVRQGEVLYQNDEKQQSLSADTIVAAGGYQANDSLLRELEGKVPQVIPVGDCVEPRRLKEAIHEGFWTAMKV